MGYLRCLGVIFWGLICLILWFISLFSLLHLVFAYFGFNCRFELLKPKCMDKRRTYKALMINEVRKGGLKHPTTTKSCQTPTVQEEDQNAALKTNKNGGARSHHGLTVVGTTSRGGCRGRGGPLFPWCACFFSEVVQFPHGFGCSSLTFDLKWVVFCWKKGAFHHCYPKTLSKTFIRDSYLGDWKKKKEGLA